MAENVPARLANGASNHGYHQLSVTSEFCRVKVTRRMTRTVMCSNLKSKTLFFSSRTRRIAQQWISQAKSICGAVN